MFLFFQRLIKMEVLLLISFFVVKTYTTSIFVFILSLRLYAIGKKPFWLFPLCLMFPIPGVLSGIFLAWVYESVYFNQAEKYGSLRSPWIRSLRFWNILFWYFGLNWQGSHHLEETGKDPVIITFSPHGFWPIGTMCLIASLKRDIVFAISSTVFCIPIVREIFLLMGCIEATPEAITTCMDQGISVALTPGGVSEMLLSNVSFLL